MYCVIHVLARNLPVGSFLTDFFLNSFAKISALKSGMGKNAIMEYVEFLYICLSRKDAVTDSQTNSG